MKSKKPKKPRAQLPADDGTVSGLDEKQIDPGDLARLHEACRLARLLPVQPSSEKQDAVPVDLSAFDLVFHTVELAVGEPVSQRVRIAPLPRRSRVRLAALPVGIILVRHDLQLALAQPIRRRQLRLGELSPVQEKELYRQLYAKYGERAQKMTVRAVFAHIPPEAAKSARISPDLSSLEFAFPADVSPRSAASGHYLVVLTNQRNKTWSVLFRL